MSRDDVVTIATAVASIGATVWAMVPSGFQLLMALIVLDAASGMLAAYRERKLDSTVGRNGFIKKAMVLVVCVSAFLLDKGGVVPGIGTAVIAWASAVEVLSILENAARAGIPVPKKLRDALDKLATMNGDDNGNQPQAGTGNGPKRIGAERSGDSGKLEP